MLENYLKPCQKRLDIALNLVCHRPGYPIAQFGYTLILKPMISSDSVSSANRESRYPSNQFGSAVNDVILNIGN